jgi:molecular chaperone GrpE
MTGPGDEDAPRVVIRDKRRIDPTTGAVRAPAGEQPAGAPAGQFARGEQMSEQETQTTGPAPAATQVKPGPAAAKAPGGDLAAQLAERTEDLQRVTAEYANYRRRVDRDRSLVADQVAERFAAQLFPIVDDIERARDHGDLTGAFKVVADRVTGLLEGLGVAAFGVAGDPFDPALHEAVMHDTSAEVSVPTATTVLRQGFRRGDRVLRTAMVAVTDPEGPVAGGGTAAATEAPQDDVAADLPADLPAALPADTAASAADQSTQRPGSDPAAG